jgi:hypothetical protein
MHQSILLGLGLLLVVANAFPVPEENYQRLSRIPPSSSQQYFFGDDDDDDDDHKHTNKPFTPGHRDPYDRKVDPIPDRLEPLPFRNGDGATVMGPRNRDRERQNPDMVRPPSTDHGTLSNMRWSFADSHTRIEVFSLALSLTSLTENVTQY